ncbi:MAG: murein L,D-transpeptidase catalytic domain family protein [Alphaproteobacteria bacterium]|nr:murein L,D-transpeptidase catalytic domain family protein [Alphaproteobacteria bacterium]
MNDNLQLACRAFAALLFCAFASACATRPPAPTCVPFEGLDPGCIISRDLLKEAVTSYRAHYKTMPVGQAVALTEGGAPMPFTTHWLRTDKFVIIDFRKAAYEKRLYVVDWKTGLVKAYHVSHGRGSAVSDRSYYAKRFTDVPGSGTSSVGAFVGGQEYESTKWGRAIRVRGLDATNQRALMRTIVFHANEVFFDKDRNIFGWSCGCFMTDGQELPAIIDTIQNGGFIYAGPISLYDKSSAKRERECNPYCGDPSRCKDVAGANPIGSLPNVAAPPPRPDPPAVLFVPDPLPGETPVPTPKPRQIMIAPPAKAKPARAG